MFFWGFLAVWVVGDLSAAPPNIVVFLSDDHTWMDSSVYGSEEIETPHMQRIANQGMVFDRAYVASPSCAPSRAALLTGMMPARNGAEANHSRPRAEIKKLPRYLQDLGYEVVSFGKVGHYAQTPEYGFDLAKHFGYHEDIAVGKAIEWLHNRSSEKRLCFFVGTNWPHVPWPPAEDIRVDQVRVPERHVDTEETRIARRKYLQAVHTMDEELGAVYDAVRNKLGNDTLFIHTSDHGAQWPFAKWNVYEEGIRTPLVVTWPGKVEPGVRTDAMVSWVDMLPTLVEVAGGDAEESAPEKLDGRSFLPVLLGQQSEHRSRILTAHSGDGSFNVFPARSLNDGRYKYIRNLFPQLEFNSHVTQVIKEDAYWPSWLEAAKGGPNMSEAQKKVLLYQRRPAEELYDLKNDPLERVNLLSKPWTQEEPSRKQLISRLRTEMDLWMAEQGDRGAIFGAPQMLPLVNRPNVIMFFIDDMGWADLSCFGGKDIHTPNIDRLAAEGLRMKSFYVNAPICSPSRVALTTGNYPARHNITSYLARRELNQKRGIADWLDENVPTLPRMMSQAGYRCGHFGKWHMGGQRDVGEAPLISRYGFDASLTNFEGLGPRVLPLCDAHDGRPIHRHDLGSAKLGHGPIMWEDRSLITARFVEEAIQFIESNQSTQQTDDSRQQPFYINVWPDDVHSPFFPPASRRGDGSKRRLYQSVLETMDEQLGILFDRIRNDPALRGNTLILLASDNGHEPGAGDGGPLRGKKGDLYEGGIRSPLIVWGPGLMQSGVQGGIDSETVVSSIDLVASLIQLCGLEPPENYNCDGIDLSGALLGYSSGPRIQPLFWRRPPDRPGTKREPLPDLAIRDKRWKLLCQIDGSHVQLYDMDIDLGETTNLAKRHPRIVRQMKERLLAWNETLPADAVTTTPVSQRYDAWGKGNQKRKNTKPSENGNRKALEPARDR